MDTQDKQKLYKEEIDNIIKFDDFKEAFNLYSKLKNSTNDKFDNFLIKLQWVALPFFSKKDILSLFSNHFKEALEMEYFDLWPKFKHVLLGIIMIEDRDKFKLEVKHVLEKNQARLTSKKLVNNLSPTSENWVKGYIGYLGSGPIDNVKLSKYFINNKDFKNLEPNEQKKIKFFFDFYEKLKLSSLTVAGFEGVLPVNTNGFKGYIQNGMLVKSGGRIDPYVRRIFDMIMRDSLSNNEQNGDNLEDLQTIASKYPAGSLERKAIEEEIRKMDVS